MGILGIFGNLKKGLKKALGRFKKGKKPSLRKKRRLPQQEEASLLLEEKRAPQIPLQKPLWALEEFSRVQLSANTQRAYKRDLEDYFVFLKTQNLWDSWQTEVGPIHVAQYRDFLHKTKKLSKPSVTRKIAVLKSFYKWSLARGWVEQNPAELVKAFPQNQDSKTGYLDEAAIDRLLTKTRERQRDSERLSGLLDRVCVETLLMLGIRRAEAQSILLGDIEILDSQWLVVIKGKGNRERRLPIPPVLLDAWTEWLTRIHSGAPEGSFYSDPTEWQKWCLQNASTPLLVSSRSQDFNDLQRISTSEIARIVRRASFRAGMKVRVHPHMLRATAITHALDNGASHRGIQQMAGWTSPLMISRYDKRRGDPRISAIHQLKYAQKIPNKEISSEQVGTSEDLAPS